MKNNIGIDLNGHRAIITGAGRGIGESCAIAIAKAGADVTLVARNKNELEEVKNKIEKFNGNASVHVADLNNMHEILSLGKLNAFTILVNNAGINKPDVFWNVY